MKEIGHLKRYKMKLTTLSPVFIGSGEKLSGLDYYFDNRKNQLNIIDENKFAKFLNTKCLLDNFINYVLQERYSKLYKWAKQQNIDLSRYQIFKKSYKFNISDIGNDIHLFIKNSYDKGYITGSSIKGVIRTAILIKKIKENPELRLKYQQKVKNIFEQCDDRKDINNRLAKIEKDIETDLLSISAPTRELSKESLDIFRGVQISDSKVIDENEFNLYKKNDYTINSEKPKPHNLPIFRECIKSYVETEFYITLDRDITKILNIDIDYILKALEEYTNNWLEIMKVFRSSIGNNVFMPDEDESYTANFCIGGGAGFLTKTIIYSIFDDRETAVKIVREYLDKSFKMHKHKTRDRVISPRTMKLAKEDDDLINLGWCNISIVKE